MNNYRTKHKKQAKIQHADENMAKMGYVRPLPGCTSFFVRRELLDQVQTTLANNPILRRAIEGDGAAIEQLVTAFIAAHANAAR